MKKCKLCGEEKELKDFAKAARNISGRRAVCQKCASEKDKIRMRKKAKEKDWYSIIIG